MPLWCPMRPLCSTLITPMMLSAAAACVSGLSGCLSLTSLCYLYLVGTCVEDTPEEDARHVGAGGEEGRCEGPEAGIAHLHSTSPPSSSTTRSFPQLVSYHKHSLNQHIDICIYETCQKIKEFSSITYAQYARNTNILF